MSYTFASILPTPSALRLPDFKTLLIQGDYPSSSPFHLCLSHLSRDRSKQQSNSSAVFVTAKSRSKIIQDLVQFNDEWLVFNAGLGATAALLSELRIFYPGTPDHWMFLFSLFRTSMQCKPETLNLNTNIYLDPPVSLVVLHEPSAYFFDQNPVRPFMVSSYLRLIMSAFTSLSCLDSDVGAPRLVVFDSRLSELSLSIFPLAINDLVDKENEEALHLARPDRVTLAVQNYFEWIGKVEIGKFLIGHIWSICGLSREHHASDVLISIAVFTRGAHHVEMAPIEAQCRAGR